MALNLGMTKGLAAQNDWDQDIARLYQREEMAARIRAEKERKTLFYANQLKQGHATNPRAEKELTEYYKGLNDQLADLFIQNPDLERNVTAMSKFLNISDKYLNNETLRIDKQVAGEFDKLRAAVANEELEPWEYEAEMKRYNDYINSEPGDPIEPYVFTKYPMVTTEQLVEDAVKLIGRVEVVSDKPNPKTGYYEYTTKMDPNKLILQVESIYANPRNKRAIDRDFDSYMKSNPSMANKYTGVNAQKNWYADRVRSADSIQKTLGGMDLAMKKAAESGSGDIVSEYALSGHAKSIIALGSDGTDNNTYQAREYDDVLTTTSGAKSFEIGPKYGILAGVTTPAGDGSTVKGTPVDLGVLGVMFTKTGNPRWVTVGGIPYLEMSGYVENPEPINSGNKERHEKIRDELDKLGFLKEEYVDNPIVNINVDGAPRSTKGLRHRGTILVPMELSPAALGTWTSKYSGQKASDEAQQIYAQPITKFVTDYYNKHKAYVDQDYYINNKLNIVREPTKEEMDALISAGHTDDQGKRKWIVVEKNGVEYINELNTSNSYKL